MQVIQHPNDIYEHSLNCKLKGQKLGLVPTMGALHEGHFSLVRAARANNDQLIVSIFINPLQFNNPSDLNQYPRTLEEDLAQLEKLGVDVVYTPHAEVMYPSAPKLSIDFGSMAKSMEGNFRPGHFSGVGVVVTKLLHHTIPDRAYFGLKDLQQYMLIRQMVKDLSFQVEVIGLPTVREASGLAMSSRNGRLSEKGRAVASNIYKGLMLAKKSWNSGKSPHETIAAANNFYQNQEGLEMDYVQLVSLDDLSEVERNDFQPVALCVAGYVERIRLIDNLYLRQD